MAMLRYFPREGSPVLYAVHKPVMTVGRALGNDVPIPDRSVKEHHAQIVFNGRDYQLEELDREADIAINGKKKRRARLVDGDRLSFGAAQLGFTMFSELPAAAPAGERDAPSELAGIRKLFQFSERLMSTPSVDELLEALLDDVIEITGASRGVVLLVDAAEGEGATPRVRASRNVNRESI
ncbi:MAG TPA: FHA domain-containing protein, partial [Polyangiaceae bacterium]|nr:FHA domain-containing protein [Polyangiaceae bacterium]